MDEEVKKLLLRFLREIRPLLLPPCRPSAVLDFNCYFKVSHKSRQG